MSGVTVTLGVWVAGVLGTLALLRRRDPAHRRWLLAVALGPACGFGTLSISYFVWRLAGLSDAGFGLAGRPALAAAILGGLVLAARSPRRGGGARPGGGVAVSLALLIGAFGLAIAALVLYSRQLPHGSFDAWAIWTSRARLLHRGSDLAEVFSLLRRAHPDYPLLLPGSLAALFALAKSESPRIPQLTGAIFALSTGLAVVVGALELGAPRKWALLAGALLLSTPNFLLWCAAQCADLPLAYLLVLAVVGLAALIDDGRSPPLPAPAAGFLAGLLAWTKNEGMILGALLLSLFAAAVLLGSSRRRGRRLLAPVMLGAAPAWLATALFRWVWAPRTDLGHFAGDLLSRLVDVERWSTVAAAFGGHLGPASGFQLWGAVWLAAAAVLVVGIVRHRPAPPPLLLSRVILLCCWLSWFGVFVGTPLELEWHLRTALGRLLLQLLPLTLAVAAAGMGASPVPAGGVSRPARAPARAAALALLASILLGGCGIGRREPTETLRLIPVTPAGGVATHELVTELEIATWDFEPTADEATGWVVTSGEVSPRGAGFALTPDSRGRVSMRRGVSLEATEVDVVRLVRAQVPSGSLTLYWAGPGQPFSATRSLAIRLNDVAGGTASDLSFLTRGHPAWSGAIERLRLDYSNFNPRRPPARLGALSARRFRLDEAALARSATTPLRIELDHERRSGFVAAETTPLSWSPERPLGLDLRFGFGTEPSVSGVTTFRVVAVRRGVEDEVFVARVGPDHLAPDRWQDALLPASQIRDADSLRFTVEYPAAVEDRSALAFWSEPVLQGTPHRDPRPDILLVSIDTLRPDHLSLYGYGRETSPELARWSESAVVFERAVTSAPWTLPAHVSMFTGLDAVHHGVNHRGRVPDDLTLLAESLRAAGYTTWAITGGGYLDPEYGLDQGFDRYRYWPHHTAEEELAAGVAAAETWLASRPPRPLFLFFHTYETHHPYRPRSPYFERFAPGRERPPAGALGYIGQRQEEASGFLLSKKWRAKGASRSPEPLTAEDQELLIALYDSGVAFADQQIGRLLARWQTDERAREAVVAVASDHGEALGEKDLAGHAYLEDFNALVPLIVRFPGGRPAGRVRSQVRLIDLAPTLLELAGLAPPEADGTSLRAVAAEGGGAHRPAWTYAAFSNRGLGLRLADRWKYTFNDTAWRPLHGQEALYDLRRDPEEKAPLPPDAERLQALRGLLTEHLRQIRGAIRVTVSNPSAEPLAGRLIGAALGPTRLKSPRLPGGGLVRERGSSIELGAAGGESYELLIESPPAGSLTVVLEPGFRQAVELAELDGPWRAARGPGGWQSAGEPASVAGRATVTVEWAAGRAALAADPASEDSELRRQLEALGYIE